MKSALAFATMVLLVSALGGRQAFATKSAHATNQKQPTTSKGIHFLKGDFADLLKQAEKENKLLFVDCYTTWCGPCNGMERDVYPQKGVGDYFNQTFIVAKFNIEQSPGDSIAQLYNIQSIPTYLCLDYSGAVVDQFGGYSEAPVFLDKAKYAQALWIRTLNQRHADTVRRHAEEQALELEKQVALTPNDNGALLKLADAYFRCDLQRDRTISLYEKLVGDERVDDSITARLGDCYFAIAEYSKALGCYEKAHEKIPNDAVGLVKAGNANLMLQKYPKALEYYAAVNQKTAERRTQVYALLGIGDALSTMGRSNEAVTAYKKALALDSAGVDCWEALAQCYLVARDFDKALQFGEQALKRSPIDPRVCNLLGQVHDTRDTLKRDDLRDATASAQYYVRAYLLDTMWIEPLLNLGGVLLANEKFEWAKAAFTTANRIDSSNALVVKGLAEVYQKLGDEDKAKEYGEKAKRLPGGTQTNLEEPSRILYNPSNLARRSFQTE